jgi:hypothetical protein
MPRAGTGADDLVSSWEGGSSCGGSDRYQEVADTVLMLVLMEGGSG